MSTQEEKEIFAAKERAKEQMEEVEARFNEMLSGRKFVSPYYQKRVMGSYNVDIFEWESSEEIFGLALDHLRAGKRDEAGNCFIQAFDRALKECAAHSLRCELEEIEEQLEL